MDETSVISQVDLLYLTVLIIHRVHFLMSCALSHLWTPQALRTLHRVLVSAAPLTENLNILWVNGTQSALRS